MTRPPVEPAPAEKRGRSVPAAYGAVSLVLVAGALTFALSSPPPSTPPLAEVAPAPQENIEVERVEQSSRFGEGGSSNDAECVAGDADCEGVGGERGEARPTATPSVVETQPGAGYRQCGHGGRTQTEDPQSPPCIATVFGGDNGGATSPGVNATTIRVAVPWKETTDESVPDAIAAFARHINQRYELYGRTLELVFVEPSANTSGAAGRRSWARDVLEERPFASLEPQTSSSGADAFYRTLSDAGVVSLVGAGEQAAASLPHLRDLPHVWSLFPTTEEALRTAGDVACRTLAGRPAQHGGDEVATRTRLFGVLQLEADGERVDAAPLSSRFDACGAPYRGYVATESDNESIAAVLTSMRSEGVTTIVCACQHLEDNVPQQAEAIGYQPEWFHPGTSEGQLGNGTTRMTTGMPHGQLQHLFGITAELRRPSVTAGAERERYEEQIWFHILREHAPDLQFDGATTRASEMYGYYAQLLVLASGIQWAGHDLTPETFGAALARTAFHNPGVGQAPWYQPAVGFSASDRTFNSNYAVFWWNAPPVPDDNRLKNGHACYLGAGTRYQSGSFPDDLDDRLFDVEAGCR